MHANHAHPAQPLSPGAPGCGGRPARLNLLLSWGGWRPDSWADRIDCLLQPMGVASIRARTARQAEQSIRTQQIHIAVVDLGLPLDATSACASHRHSEEGGARILDMLRRLETPPPTVVVKSTRFTRDSRRDLAAALRSDAFAVVDRTSADVELMLKVLQRCMERFYHGRWPGMDVGNGSAGPVSPAPGHGAGTNGTGNTQAGAGGAGGAHRLMRLFGLEFV